MEFLRRSSGSDNLMPHSPCDRSNAGVVSLDAISEGSGWLKEFTLEGRKSEEHANPWLKAIGLTQPSQ
jgi:hypothetical protein